MLIELKYDGHDVALEQRVAGIVEATGMTDGVAVMSLKYDGVQQMQSLRPEWRYGLLAARPRGDAVSDRRLQRWAERRMEMSIDTVV